MRSQYDCLSRLPDGHNHEIGFVSRAAITASPPAVPSDTHVALLYVHAYGAPVRNAGEDFGWSFEGGVLRPNHSLHVEIFDDTHGEWFTPDVLDEIERGANLEREPLRLRLRPC